MAACLLERGLLAQGLRKVLQPGRELVLRQEHHALQGKQRQLRGPLVSPVVQAGACADSWRQGGQDGVPREGVEQVQGSMVWRQQICAQIRQALCRGRRTLSGVPLNAI